jgi:hypothetical protein
MLAAAVADPERLIWQPGRKLISIPKPMPVTGVSIVGLSRVIGFRLYLGSQDFFVPIEGTPDRVYFSFKQTDTSVAISAFGEYPERERGLIEPAWRIADRAAK